MVTPVDKPHSTPIFVALDRVRHCPDTSLLTNPGPLEVKLRSTRLTLFLTVYISDDENVESLFEVMAPTQVYSFS